MPGEVLPKFQKMSLSAWNDQHSTFIFTRNKFQTGRASSVLYLVILSAVSLFLCSLPFIIVPISVNSQGTIQPAIERTALFTPVSGRIAQIRIKDNQNVRRGDTVLLIDSSLPGQQNKILSQRLKLLRNLLLDAVRIVRFAEQGNYPAMKPVFMSGQYNLAWQQFIHEFDEGRINKDQAERAYKRHNILYKNAVITLSEIERIKFEYDKALSDQSLLISRYKSKWEQEAGDYRRELSELLSREAEIAEQNKLFIQRIPVNGSVQNLAGIQPGSWVIANQKIAEVSPDTQLIVVCYIKPSDIGLVRKGQSVSIQVDAYNYNQWGLMSGKVTEISDDVILSDSGLAVFKVRCSLDSDHLKLKNKHKGFLRKGMSVTARFMVAERTLFDLLYDQLDDWLNPNLSVKAAGL